MIYVWLSWPSLHGTSKIVLLDPITLQNTTSPSISKNYQSFRFGLHYYFTVLSFKNGSPKLITDVLPKINCVRMLLSY